MKKLYLSIGAVAAIIAILTLLATGQVAASRPHTTLGGPALVPTNSYRLVSDTFTFDGETRTYKETALPAPLTPLSNTALLATISITSGCFKVYRADAPEPDACSLNASGGSRRYSIAQRTIGVTQSDNFADQGLFKVTYRYGNGLTSEFDLDVDGFWY